MDFISRTLGCILESPPTMLEREALLRRLTRDQLSLAAGWIHAIAMLVAYSGALMAPLLLLLGDIFVARLVFWSAMPSCVVLIIVTARISKLITRLDRGLDCEQWD